MSLFEPGPWDKRQGSDSAHVFSKKRKLLYGNDHDRADLVEGGGEGYGQREQHRLHTVWRRGALQPRAIHRPVCLQALRHPGMPQHLTGELLVGPGCGARDVFVSHAGRQIDGGTPRDRLRCTSPSPNPDP